MNAIKLLGWNINQRSGVRNSKIEQEVVEEIIRQSPDVCVLTEYVKAQNHNTFVERLVNEGYCVLFDPRYMKGTNEVFIACKKDLLTNDEPKVITFPVDENNPNFLCAVLKFQDGLLNIIGFRIKIRSCRSNQEGLNADYKARRIQFDNLKSYIENIQGATIVIGDFNNSYFSDGDNINSYHGKARHYYNYPLIKEETESIGFSLHTPNGHSCGKNLKLDHILSKGCEVSNLNYDWTFTANPLYCHSTIGHPDHAILLAKIIIAGETK